MDSNRPLMRNIGEQESSRLRAAGVAAMVCGLALGDVVIYHEVPSWMLFVVFLSIWLGASALLQARERTSVVLAARRLRRIDGKEEREQYVLTLRERARMIQRRSLFVAVLFVTLLTLCR